MENVLRIIEISTDRLICRKYDFQDFNCLHSYVKIPEVSQYEQWGPNTPSDTEKYLESCIKQYDSENGRQDFAVVLKESNELIGGFSVKPMDNSACSIGYLISPSHQSIGLATELTASLVERLHARYFDSVLAQTDSRNEWH